MKRDTTWPCLAALAIATALAAGCGGASQSGALPPRTRLDSTQAVPQVLVPGTLTRPAALFYTVGGESGDIGVTMSASASGASNKTIVVPRAPLVDTWGWIADEPMGVSTWPAATYTVSLNVAQPNSDVRVVRVKIYRVDANGGPGFAGLSVLGEADNLSVSLGTAGVQTFTISGAAQDVDPSDRLAVKFYTSTSSGSSQSFAYAAGQGSGSSVAIDTGSSPAPSPTPAAVSRVTLVVMENHDYADIIGNPQAPYFNSLAANAAVFTNSHGVTHPSEPNYLALFSGSTQGVNDDACPYTFSTPNLAGELASAGLSFAGYAEDTPSDPSTCQSGNYWRRHVPWTDFTDVPPDIALNYSGPIASLNATVTMIVPNACDDMHQCSVTTGDSWLSENLPSIIAYDNANNGLLIVTFDEGRETTDNHIPTIMTGPAVVPGQYGQYITHYSVLRTIEDLFGLPALGESANVSGVEAALR